MAADSYEDIAVDKGNVVPGLEVPPQDLYHAKSFWTRWIFCQDAKIIGIQYSITAWVSRISSLHWSVGILSICHNARHDYGYLSLNRIISGRIW